MLCAKTKHSYFFVVTPHLPQKLEVRFPPTGFALLCFCVIWPHPT